MKTDGRAAEYPSTRVGAAATALSSGRLPRLLGRTAPVVVVVVVVLVVREYSCPGRQLSGAADDGPYCSV